MFNKPALEVVLRFNLDDEETSHRGVFKHLSLTLAAQQG
jgi:hypothetical protein